MVMKENCNTNTNKPHSSSSRKAKKSTHAPLLKIDNDFVVQTPADSDDDMNDRVESVLAAAVKTKKKIGTARKPLQQLQQSTRTEKKVTKLQHAENSMSAEVNRLLSICLCAEDNTSSEIHELAARASALAPTEHQTEDDQTSDVEETVMLLLKELMKQSAMVTAVAAENEDAMRQIFLFEQIIREKDKELGDLKHYNEMNDCANKRMLTFASERYEEQLKVQRTRVASLIEIIQRQQFGGSEYVNSLIREKCILERKLSKMKLYLEEEALSDKQHLKRVQCVVVVVALVSSYIALATGLLDSFLYIAPCYFIFVFFAIV